MKHGMKGLLTAMVLACACGGAAQVRAEDAQEVPDVAALTTIQKSSIAGLWRAESVAIALSTGTRKTITNRDGERPFSVTVSAKKFTMRIGDKVLADLSYTLDTSASPWKIDLKSAAGAMVGICQRDGEQLKISLNDEAKGRPTQFEDAANGMILVLKQFHAASLFTINADGSDMRRILTLPDYTSIGSPEWSNDGTRIAFDCWKSIYGEGFGNVHMLIVNADGTNMKHLGDGAMPCWSHDDKHFTCSVSGEGVLIMDADGSNRRVIDAKGWGSQWSPTRNEIAYGIYEDNGMNLGIYDVATEKRRSLLKTPYRQIYWGISWSPDSAWICFRGVLADGATKLVAVSTEGEEKGLKIILPDTMPDVKDFDNCVAWSGKGQPLVVALDKQGEKGSHLYLFDVEGKEAPKRFPGIPDDFGGENMGWCSDGKRMTFSTHAPLRPAE